MYQIMFYGGTVLAGIFFIASVVLFVRNRVWKLFGDLTGWNARKAIKILDKKGAEDTSKTEAIKSEVSKVLVHKATTTGTLKKMPDQEDAGTPTRPEKGKKIRKKRSKKEEKTALLQQREPETDGIFEVEEDMVVLAGSKNTNLLQEEVKPEEITTLLTSEAEQTTSTSVPEGDDGETSLLVPEGDDGETTLLVPEGDDSETTLLVSGGDDSETTLLVSEGDDGETTLLVQEGDDDATTLLVSEGDDDATTLLVSDDADATTLLASEARMPKFEPVLQEDEELMALLQGTSGGDR